MEEGEVKEAKAVRKERGLSFFWYCTRAISSLLINNTTLS